MGVPGLQRQRSLCRQLLNGVSPQRPMTLAAGYPIPHWLGNLVEHRMAPPGIAPPSTQQIAAPSLMTSTAIGYQMSGSSGDRPRPTACGIPSPSTGTVRSGLLCLAPVQVLTTMVSPGVGGNGHQHMGRAGYYFVSLQARTRTWSSTGTAPSQTTTVSNPPVVMPPSCGMRGRPPDARGTEQRVSQVWPEPSPSYNPAQGTPRPARRPQLHTTAPRDVPNPLPSTPKHECLQGVISGYAPAAVLARILQPSS